MNGEKTNEHADARCPTCGRHKKWNGSLGERLVKMSELLSDATIEVLEGRRTIEPAVLEQARLAVELIYSFYR